MDHVDDKVLMTVGDLSVRRGNPHASPTFFTGDVCDLMWLPLPDTTLYVFANGTAPVGEIAALLFNGEPHPTQRGDRHSNHNRFSNQTKKRVREPKQVRLRAHPNFRTRNVLGHVTRCGR